ncbi:unnamed protein product [Scytosiphon promiscuus]
MDIAIKAVQRKTAPSTERNTKSSDAFLLEVDEARAIFAGLGSEGRNLTSQEVRELEFHGNWASDWSLVRVSKGGSDGDIPAGRVRGCFFHGPVQLGSLRGEIDLSSVSEQYSQPCGVYNSTLAWCVVGDGALIKGCNAISCCVVCAGAAVINCGLVSCSQPPPPLPPPPAAVAGGDGGGGGPKASPSGGGDSVNSIGNGDIASGSAPAVSSKSCCFGNGLAVAVGPETAGRELACYATMTLAEAAAAAADRSCPEAVKELRAAVDRYAELARCGATVIGRGAVVMSCSRVVDVFVGTNALLEASAVENATILSTAEEPSRVTCGSTVTSSLVQQGVTVDRGCIVSDSVLMEHSHVDNHGKLQHSVLGPDSGVGAGECLHCLVGPFVGFHHQSLLIATIWPLGRGNVGYGANSGSRMLLIVFGPVARQRAQADQEIWPGEGVFFGLSTVVKFPANYSESPFTVIGSGVTCLPQRVAFPFCLINSQEQSGLPGVSPGLNHLRPGWVLSESMYMVIRSEDKYRRRAKARRNRVDWAVFRPSMMRLIVDARARLIAAGVNKKEVYVGDRGVAGLGKNYMTEASRLEGIATYTLHLRRYALRGLLARLEDSSGHSAATDRFFLEGGPTNPASPGNDGDGGGVGRMPPPQGNAVETARLLMLEQEQEEPPLEFGGGAGRGRSGGAGVGGGDDGAWELQEGLLMSEFGEGERGVVDLMEKLIAIEAQVAKAVETSKAKDDKRGSQVIPGYADAHTPAKLEVPVKLAYSQQAEVEGKAHAVISRL